MKKLVSHFTRYIEHEKDIEYFTQYKAPIMELLQSTHFININATIPFFGPMLYFLIRALRCEKVLEIGHAEGYTSYYMANAVNDNAIRFGYSEPMYYGVDIIKSEEVSRNLSVCGLPNTILNLDTIKLDSDTFKDIKFDLIFQDGPHDTEHVLYELGVLYPQLKGEGKGYWIFHDSRGPAEDAWKKLKELIKQGNYNFEYV